MKIFAASILTWLLNQTAYGLVFNNPYPSSEANKKIFYSSFTEQPKTLDPARSYSSNEYQFIMQIYEPLLGYDYFVRPYKLVPLLAKNLPETVYLSETLQALGPESQEKPAYTIYKISIKPGTYFQPHPALAKNKEGKYLYLDLPPNYLDKHGIFQLSDFKHQGSRELKVDDFIYQIKRLANPKVSSPISGLMSEHIWGFAEFRQSLNLAKSQNFLDLRAYNLKGLRKIDDYNFEIILIGQYPQFLFWLAMPFFAPLPWEADKFYSQVEMIKRNLSLDWYPLGTGPFMLVENNPNRRMRMLKNPKFRSELFPTNASEEDLKKGYLHHVGKNLPLVNEANYTLEKESIPRWNKFLQGYYDYSTISNDSFDQAISTNSQGEPILSADMQAKHMRLSKSIDPTIYYLGFNMLDPVVGGRSERARKLRLAISIAVNYDENIAIFYNGRGHAAQGPIPPGIFGYKEGKNGINPYVYRWDGQKAQRLDLSYARKLMQEAGYPNGRSKASSHALVLHYDVPVTSGPDDKSQLEWMRKQFAKLGIDLDVRATQYNRFQEKMRTGSAQIFSWGWNADYPDPENFLFMLYSGNGKVAFGGENAANYSNKVYDHWFEEMKNRPNDNKRQELIDKMVNLLRKEAPWAWGINTESLILSQNWVSPTKPNTISVGQLKYMDINLAERNSLRGLWNQALLWPLGILIIIFIFCFLPVFFAYWRKEKAIAPRRLRVKT